MKGTTTYSFFTLSIIHVFLLSLLWSNTFSYCHIFIDSNSDHIEMCGTDESENEEENKEKESIDEFFNDLVVHNIENSRKRDGNSIAKDFLVLFHPEQFTPPPEYSTLVVLG